MNCYLAMPLLLRSTISAVEERLHLPDFIESPITELTRSIIPALEEALKKVILFLMPIKFYDQC